MTNMKQVKRSTQVANGHLRFKSKSSAFLFIMIAFNTETIGIIVISSKNVSIDIFEMGNEQSLLLLHSLYYFTR